MNKLKIITFIFIFLSGIYVNGYFIANTSEGAFNHEPESSNGNVSISTSLGQLVIEGAGYFLQSGSDYRLFLKKVELSAISGLNTGELLPVLDGAVKNMELAKETYHQLFQLTGSLEYDAYAQERLRDFDYRAYREKHRLNPAVFQQVEELLKNGDVRGCYRKCRNTAAVILAGLRDIENDAEAGNFPSIPACWRVNQMFLELELFGQYASEVFMNLK